MDGYIRTCVSSIEKLNSLFYCLVNGGASPSPCSETYAGPEPFSEAETAALFEFLEPLGSKINLYLSFHSQGQYVLFPYGHSYETTEYHDILVHT